MQLEQAKRIIGQAMAAGSVLVIKGYRKSSGDTVDLKVRLHPPGSLYKQLRQDTAGIGQEKLTEAREWLVQHGVPVMEAVSAVEGFVARCAAPPASTTDTSSQSSSLIYRDGFWEDGNNVGGPLVLLGVERVSDRQAPAQDDIRGKKGQIIKSGVDNAIAYFTPMSRYIGRLNIVEGGFTDMYVE